MVDLLGKEAECWEPGQLSQTEATCMCGFQVREEDLFCDNQRRILQMHGKGFPRRKEWQNEVGFQRGCCSNSGIS